MSPIWSILHKGEYAGGIYYWLAQHSNGVVDKEWSLLSFDMEDELFHWVDLPESSRHTYSKLFEQKGSIAMVCCEWSNNERWLHVWSRIGDRFDASWIKQYAISPGYKFGLFPLLL
ncbi:hypothetical protein Droror1_Dr00009915 [Drosera rotundifolia]